MAGTTEKVLLPAVIDLGLAEKNEKKSCGTGDFGNKGAQVRPHCAYDSVPKKKRRIALCFDRVGQFDYGD